MKIRDPHERLRTAWGLIDRQHNRLIAEHLVGRRVLDIGCGYGSLVAYLRSCGYEAEGIDLDRDAIEAGRRLFPENPIRFGNAESLDDWAPHSFDSITLKDSLHHLVCEGDFPSAARTFRRVLAPGGRLVILDPNPTWIVRLARRLAAHNDVEASPQRAALRTGRKWLCDARHRVFRDGRPALERRLRWCPHGSEFATLQLGTRGHQRSRVRGRQCGRNWKPRLLAIHPLGGRRYLVLRARR